MSAAESRVSVHATIVCIKCVSWYLVDETGGSLWAVILRLAPFYSPRTYTVLVAD